MIKAAKQFVVTQCKSNVRRFMIKINDVKWRNKQKVLVQLYADGTFRFAPDCMGEGRVYSSQVKNGVATIYVTESRSMPRHLLIRATTGTFTVNAKEDGLLVASPSNSMATLTESQPYRAACLRAIVSLMQPLGSDQRWVLVEDLWNILETTERKTRACLEQNIP